MIKDTTRDYIIAAFNLYAVCNCPTTEEIHKRLHTQFNSAQLLDLLAVSKTMEQLRTSDRDYIYRAVEAVYFKQPFKKLQKGEIESRVVDFAIKNYVDERSVWRWLKEARTICAEERGLNIYPTIENNIV